jgi:23S rRNA pseudouridine2457 synthase
MLIALHKPWGVLSQFTAELPEHRTLADFGLPHHVYPIGRLDRDSEGLLLLSDETALVDRLLNPHNAHPRRYAVQVENRVTSAALQQLERGVVIEGKVTRPCRAWHLAPDDSMFPPRDGPPIRQRQSIPTDWIAMELTEGRNRQVRKMTASVGHPTLRLIRVQIGQFDLSFADLPGGDWKELSTSERTLVLSTDRHGLN